MNQMITQANQSGVTEILTLAQIEARFPDEWVLIENPELDEDLEIVQGRVIAHSPDRATVDSQALRLRPRFSAYHFTGELPEFLALNL